MFGSMLKKIQTKLKDTNTIAQNMQQAQNEQKPLAQEQILKNTSMAPKPPSALANTSGRPPVAPPTPEPAPSNLQAEPLNVIAPGKGGNDPWTNQTPLTNFFKTNRDFFNKGLNTGAKLLKAASEPEENPFIESPGNVAVSRLNSQLRAGAISRAQYNEELAKLNRDFTRK